MLIGIPISIRLLGKFSPFKPDIITNWTNTGHLYLEVSWLKDYYSLAFGFVEDDFITFVQWMHKGIYAVLTTQKPIDIMDLNTADYLRDLR